MTENKINITKKLWVDDLRPPPDGNWYWAQNYSEAMWYLKNFVVNEISLDNDLGENQPEGRKIVLWMAENEKWPEKVNIHSANVVAKEYMEGMIKRYKPDNNENDI